MKIWDCFNFYNELDLLELRLEELYDVVDHFVLCENTVTHMGDDKPLYFEENKERYSKYLDKIVHVVVDDMKGKGRAYIDIEQKNRCIDGLSDCTRDDLIIYSDLDEIPIRSKLKEVIEEYKVSKQPFCLQGNFHCYFLNGIRSKEDEFQKWNGPTGISHATLETSGLTLNQLRDLRDKHPHIKIFKEAACHLTYIGTPEQIEVKLRNWGHAVDLGKNFMEGVDDVPAKIKSFIDEGKFLFNDHRVRYVPVNDIPMLDCFSDNQEKFSHLVKEV